MGKKTKLHQFFVVNQLIIIMSLYLISNKAEGKIILPPQPGPENERTLLGVDTNKNEVRDDVEIYLFKRVYGDEELYYAWMKEARAHQRLIANYPDLEKVKKLEDEWNDSIRCVELLKDRKSAVNSSNLISLIFNTKERQKVDRWYAKSYDKIRKPFPQGEFKKEVICKF